MGQFKNIGTTYDEQVDGARHRDGSICAINRMDHNLELKRLGGCSSLNQEKLNGIDLLLVIGNDETILKVGVLAAREGITILGVNARELSCTKGFLALGFYEAEKLPDYLEGKFQAYERPLLQISVDGTNEWKDILSAVVTSGGTPAIDITTFHMSGEKFPGESKLISVEISTCYARPQDEPLKLPFWDYYYEFIRTDGKYKHSRPGRIDAPGFKLKVDLSGDDVTGTLTVDKHSTELAWSRAETIEFRPSPLITKILYWKPEKIEPKESWDISGK